MSKEVIYSNELHGLIFNKRIISFDQIVLCDFIANFDNSKEMQRELVHTLLANEYKNKSILRDKVNYGDLNVTFSKDISTIEKYKEIIEELLKGKIELEDFNDYREIFDSVCNIDEEDKERSNIYLILQDLMKRIEVNMLSSNQIVYYELFHSAVYNTRVININEKVLNNFILNFDETKEKKQELILALLSYQYKIADFIKKDDEYGDTNIVFAENVIQIKEYEEKIRDVLKGSVTEKEFDKIVKAFNDFLDLSEKENELTLSILKPLKENLNIMNINSENNKKVILK